MNDGTVHEFIKTFRRHFLEQCQPKFLPLGWDVEHKIFRDFGEHSKFKNEYEFDEGQSPSQPKSF